MAKLRLSRPLSALASKREAVRQFTPSWFTVVMSTGIVGQIIGTFPYDAPGKLEAGWAFWWLALALLLVFLFMLACRFIFFWRDAVQLFSLPFQAMFLGAVPMALATIINGLPIFVAHYWDRAAVMAAAVVLWWVMAAVALLCTLLLPFFMFTLHRTELDRMTALWLLPVLPCVVGAGSAGVVARAAEPGSAIHVLYCGYLLWGIGVPLSLMIMTIYLRRLLAFSIPPKELVVSSFLPVGPMGMGAVALLNLGAAAARLYPPPTAADLATAVASGTGPVSDATLTALEEANQGLIVSVGGVVVAFIMWGFGLWWLAVAVFSVCASCRQMTFNIGWWGFVFPLGVFTTAANELWRRLPDMQPLRVVTAVLASATVALWAFVFANTLWHGWNGSLFYAPCLAKDKSGKLSGSSGRASGGMPAASGPGLESFPDALHYCEAEEGQVEVEGGVAADGQLQHEARQQLDDARRGLAPRRRGDIEAQPLAAAGGGGGGQANGHGAHD